MGTDEVVGVDGGEAGRHDAQRIRQRHKGHGELTVGFGDLKIENFRDGVVDICAW